MKGCLRIPAAAGSACINYSICNGQCFTDFIDGNYYSSSGPEIYDWGVRDGKVWIDTSNVNHVNFVCGNIINDGTTVLGERFKDTLNHAEYALKGHETYIRVEAVDKYGRTAWTNPIYLEW